MSIRDLVFIALFAAFIIVLGLIPAIAIPVLPGVPITMQGIGFMLAGALLGWKCGFLCAVVIWVLVAAGLPILAGGRGGLGVFAGPTVGYLFGNGFGAALIGFLFEKFYYQEQSLKSVKRLRHKNYGKTQELEQFLEKNDTSKKNILNYVKIATFLTLGGVIVTYGMGILYLYTVTAGASLGTLLVANLAFLLGDIFKIVICCAIIEIVNKSYPASFLPKA